MGAGASAAGHRTTAADLERDAARCRQLADDIDARRLRLDGRLDPVRELHTTEVWDSAAASRSRLMIQRAVSTSLWYLQSDLAATVGQLHDRADELDGRAAWHRREAERLDAEQRAAHADVVTG